MIKFTFPLLNGVLEYAEVEVLFQSLYFSHTEMVNLNNP